MLMKKLGRFLFETFQVIIFAISIFLFIYLLIVQPHKIKGESMEPNFSDGEFLLTDKISYRFGEPQRGDVIVFQPPGVDQDFIKRVIGLPGEEVMVQNGQIYINSTPLDEPYLKQGDSTPPGKFAIEGVAVQVPENTYFVLGDNRHNSLDSRSFGFVAKEGFSGRAWFVYWPIDISGRLVRPEYNL
jgi:signal peptidase I